MPSFTGIALDPLINFCTLAISKSVSGDPMPQMVQMCVCVWGGVAGNEQRESEVAYCGCHG